MDHILCHRKQYKVNSIRHSWSSDRLAFEFATKNRVEHRFNPDTQMAGDDWVCGFFRRHLRLSLRKPEPTSAARASGFNKATVYIYIF